MAGLRRLLDHPSVLADGPSARASLACQRAFAVPRASPCMDRHVDRHRRADRSVAQHRPLFDPLVVDSRRPAVRSRHLHLLPLGSSLQLGATRRPARSSRRKPAISVWSLRAFARESATPSISVISAKCWRGASGTGLIVCWVLTAFAIVTGAVMIRMEDAELEKRFGAEFSAYRQRVHAVLPKLGA